jgi:hypothetical protein
MVTARRVRRIIFEREVPEEEYTKRVYQSSIYTG